MDAISSRGSMFLGIWRVGACNSSVVRIVGNSTVSPLNSVLKSGLIPKSGGKSITYTSAPNFLVTRKEPAKRACSLVKLPWGNRFGLQRIRTISPTLSCLSFRLIFAEAAYDYVLRENHRLTYSWTSLIYLEKSRSALLGLGGNGNELRSRGVWGGNP
jgi:hypothetical protein